MESEVHTGQCYHCGDITYWVRDPAPDLCALCAMAGRWSALWGPDQSAEYLAFVHNLVHPLCAMREREKQHD